jgi:hypothetical protein
MDEGKLRAIEALAEKRTPGAWRAKDHVVDAYRGDAFDAHVACCDGCGEAQDAANAAAVAALANHAEELLAAARVARAAEAFANTPEADDWPARQALFAAVIAWRKAAGR